MKRVLFVILGLAGAFVAVLAIAVGMMFVGRKTLQGTGPLADGVVALKDGITSAYCIDAGDGQYVLVDAGMDAKGEAILAGLAEQHIQPEAIRAVLVTHGHPDHTAAIPLFHNAEIVALQAETGVLAGTEGSHAPMHYIMPSPKATGLHITHPIQDGETFTVNKLPIRVFAVPGHTPGSAAYLAHGALFLGDSADASRDGKFQAAPWLSSDDSAQNVAALKQLAQRLAPDAESVRTLVFAHSGALHEGLAPLTAFAAAP